MLKNWCQGETNFVYFFGSCICMIWVTMNQLQIYIAAFIWSWIKNITLKNKRLKELMFLTSNLTYDSTFFFITIYLFCVCFSKSSKRTLKQKSHEDHWHILLGIFPTPGIMSAGDGIQWLTSTQMLRLCF